MQEAWETKVCGCPSKVPHGSDNLTRTRNKTEIDRVKFVRGVCVVVMEKTNKNW